MEKLFQRTSGIPQQRVKTNNDPFFVEVFRAFVE